MDSEVNLITPNIDSHTWRNYKQPFSLISSPTTMTVWYQLHEQIWEAYDASFRTNLNGLQLMGPWGLQHTNQKQWRVVWYIFHTTCEKINIIIEQALPTVASSDQHNVASATAAPRDRRRCRSRKTQMQCAVNHPGISAWHRGAWSSWEARGEPTPMNVTFMYGFTPTHDGTYARVVGEQVHRSVRQIYQGKSKSGCLSYARGRTAGHKAKKSVMFRREYLWRQRYVHYFTGLHLK